MTHHIPHIVILINTKHTSYTHRHNYMYNVNRFWDILYINLLRVDYTTLMYKIKLSKISNKILNGYFFKLFTERNFNKDYKNENCINFLDNKNKMRNDKFFFPFLLCGLLHCIFYFHINKNIDIIIRMNARVT